MVWAITFLVFCCACSVLAFVRHPIYGFYFYLAATYVFPPGRWWGYVFDGTRWSLIAALVTIAAVMVHRGKLKPKPFWLKSVPAMAMVLYVTWMWIQTPWAIAVQDHVEGSAQFLKYVFAFWFVYRIADTKEHTRDVLFAHMLGCGLLGMLAFMAGRQGDRLDGVGGPGMDDANTLGMYLATGAMTALGLVLTQTGWRRWVAVAAGALILEGLVLTNTRGSFLGLIGGAVAFAVFKSKVHRRLFWVVALTGLVGFASIVDQAFIDRMWSIRDSTVDSEETDQSARSRIIVARAQWLMFFDYPMGSGYRGTVALSPRYLEQRWLTADANGESARASHNTFLTTLVEQGLPGALIFIWVTLWTPLAMARLRSREAQHRDPEISTLAATIVAVLAAVFVAGNTADFLMAEVQFWMFAALVTLERLATSVGPIGQRPLPVAITRSTVASHLRTCVARTNAHAKRC